MIMMAFFDHSLFHFYSIRPPDCAVPRIPVLVPYVYCYFLNQINKHFAQRAAFLTSLFSVLFQVSGPMQLLAFFCADLARLC
jgi:hypothetical protein